LTREPTNTIPIAQDAQVTGDEERTRFALELTEVLSAPAVVYQLFDPPRVVIDIPEVKFQLPPYTGNDGGLIRAFTYGKVDNRKSRVVIDLETQEVAGH
jgi:N-acetylmuramoyl-L-alanine amidase